MIIVSSLVLAVIINTASCTYSNIHFLEQGEEFSTKADIAQRKMDPLQIYCYKGRPKYIIHIWQTVALVLNLKNDNYVQYDGSTPQDVMRKHEEHRSSWSLNWFTTKQKRFRLDPFNQSCIGIDSYELYNVQLHVTRIDYWKVSALIVGVLLFCSAERLSQNPFFYYVCGISVGISASILILFYFISKLFPRKPMMYGVAICGWTIGVYMLQILAENIRVIISNYQAYVLWYIFITGIISFIVCYRWGPVTNQRTKNIIKWSLQCLALLFVLFSSEFQEAAMGQIIILFMSYNFPRQWISKSHSYWRSKFPPKVKPLSNDEYYHEGVRETTKALDELREFCSSPECNQWKTVLKLKDVKRYKQNRFASFIEGNSHLSDDEIMEYETSIHNNDLTDDDEDYTDDD